MTFGNFDHYGYDADNYNDCIDLIRHTDIRHFRILNKWFLAVNILYLALSMFNKSGVPGSGIFFYLIFIVIAAAFEVFSYVSGKSVERYALPVIYADMLVLMSYGILMSVSFPDMTATMFMVLMVVVAVSYIDTPYRMAAAMAVFTAAFLVMSFKVKSISIAYRDMFNALIFFALAFILHFLFQRNRMRQFITLQKNNYMQNELEARSGFDELTSLVNRSRFFAIAGSILRTDHKDYMALCLIDLDGLKQINDRLGHKIGDKAIQIAGNTLAEILKLDLSEKASFQNKVAANKLTFAGRLGGDEFIILIRGRNGREEVIALLQEVLSSLNRVDYGELKGIHASFGVTEISEKDTDIDDAYRRADEALYESKRAGKNQIRFSS